MHHESRRPDRVNHAAQPPEGRLDVSRIFEGTRLVIVGGTGFLGKVFWSMLLDRYPNVGRLFLVVRPKPGVPPEARFWADIATSEAVEPLKHAHGERFEAF